MKETELKNGTIDLILEWLLGYRCKRKQSAVDFTEPYMVNEQGTGNQKVLRN